MGIRLAINYTTAILLGICLYSLNAHAGKKSCESYKKKWKNIQSQQRLKNSLKRSISLRDREDKARDMWWNCEKGTLKSKSTRKKAIKNSKNTYLPERISKLPKYSLNPKLSPNPTFSQPISIKASYDGKVLSQWLGYYKPEKECARPKTTQIFAACLADKETQKLAFEQSLTKSNE